MGVCCLSWAVQILLTVARLRLGSLRLGAQERGSGSAGAVRSRPRWSCGVLVGWHGVVMHVQRGDRPSSNGRRCSWSRILMLFLRRRRVSCEANERRYHITEMLRLCGLTAQRV